MAGPIPDFGWSSARDAVDDPFKFFVENLFEQIKKYTGIDLFWMLDWSWTTNTIMELVRQANDLMAWLQNPIQRPPNLLSRPSFSSPSAIAAAPDWSWDAVVSLGTVTGPGGLPRTDPQGSARTTADGARHALMSNAISDASAVAAGQILTCQIHALVEDGFTAADDQAIRLELVPSLKGVLQDAVVLAHCGVPDGDSSDWIAAPAGSKAVFFDVDYEVPKVGDIPDTVELRLVVSESAGGDVPVRFDGARVAAAGGFLVVLADLFDAGRQYLTDMWAAIEAWVQGIFDQSAWTALKTDTDAAWALFVKRVKRALRHADADSYVPPSTSGIISDALKQNPWFGWLFQLVDDWLEPILKIGKACADFGDACWQAVTVFVGNVTAPNAWQTMVSSIETAWDLFIRAVFISWGSTEAEANTKAEAMPNPSTATTAALRNNAWFGWFFDMVDDWLQPVLNIGKAVTDFGDSCWKAITTFAADPGASGAWTTMTGAINSAWNTMVDAVLAAWGSDKTHADFASLASATEAALKNNPVTGWLWGNSGTSWLNLFDPVRRYINQMIEGLHWGYFDSNWAWVPSLTIPNSEKPSGNAVMTPGRGDDTPAISPGVDATIPGKPTGVVAIPWLDLTVPGFPAGNITYAIAAVKGGVEGPAAMVTVFAGTLFPPNCSGRVDLAYSAPTGGADSYRIYREVDDTYAAQAWRLVATPATDYPALSPPLSDKVTRSDATNVAHPKTDAELSTQVVKSTADGANTGVQAIADGINQAITGTTDTGSAKTAAAIKANLTAIPPKNITAHDYTGIAFDTYTFSLAPNASTFIPPSKITTFFVNGESMGASATQGIWLKEPGLYDFEVTAAFTASAGLAGNCVITPLLIRNSTPPPSTGTWTGSSTTPCGTCVTVVNSSVRNWAVGKHIYQRTDPGNLYFLPGFTFDNASTSNGSISLQALIVVATKISS
ncbi:hypothetical protein BST28_18820 [Mycolicibacter kumamotonensis]|uniref:Uncharacterized protein n=1 Tax=Mycolicibacter kumamotonensis TaxID=354243 RepID=A0A1X0DXJ4_9MYCO|nr:hypothetical protein [Mycolicibacter kumamotonensis]ORA77174.1 hypothetical protein BST28_18820 [Mycolicibacter kumamotonensis]